MEFSRYAVYVTLPEGPLDAFGAAWLGWDAKRGRPVAAPEVAGLPQPPHDITATPRKYGLHGTVKPPFRLAPGTTPDSLAEALAAHCAAQPKVTLDGLALSRLGGFLALTPTGDTTALAALAGSTVAALDAFRAPATEAELAKRRKSGLTPRQDALLVQWGYPYVMEEFRFHITLSGRLGAEADAVKAALAPHVTPLVPQPFTVDALTLCGEDDKGMFHELHRYALS